MVGVAAELFVVTGRPARPELKMRRVRPLQYLRARIVTKAWVMKRVLICELEAKANAGSLIPDKHLITT